MHIQINSFTLGNHIGIQHEHMELVHGCLVMPDILWHVVARSKLTNWQSWIITKNIRQCSISKIYDSHEYSTWKAHRCVAHSILKKLSAMIDMGLYLGNSIRGYKCGTDPKFDKHIVRSSEIGLCQPYWPLCIHVIVNYMIIINNSGP